MQASERLRAARLSGFFDQAAAGMSETSLDGRFLRVNDRYCEITGRSREELLSLRMQDITHPDDLPGNIPLFRAAIREGGGFEIEKRYVRPDGTSVWVHNSVTAIREQDGEVAHTVCVTIDISERRAAEEQLRRNQDTFYNLIQNNPFGVYVVDADFRLAEASIGSRKVFENVRPLIGRDFADVLRIVWAEPFASEAIGRFRHTLETGEPYSSPSTVELRGDIGRIEAYDWRIERIELPDGRHGVVCYFYDLSERQQWEAAVRDREERLRRVLDQLFAFVGITTPDGTLIEANRAPLEAAGIAPEDVLRKPFWDAYWWSYDAAVQAQLQDAISRARAGETVRYDVPVRLAGGELVTIDFQISPLRDAEGTITHLIPTATVVEERVRAQEQLRQLNASLEERVAQRTAERDRVWRNSRDLLVVIDRRWHLTAVNPAVTALLGYEPEEAVGRRFADFVHPDDLKSASRSIRAAAAAPVGDFEARVRARDGSWRWFSWSAAPGEGEAYVSGRDITAERERQAQLEAAEAARKEADALYRGYFENTPEALFVIAIDDDGGFTVEEVNPAHEAGVGFKIEDIRGKRIDDILPPDIARRVIETYRKVVDTGAMLQYREVFDLSGEPQHWDTSIVPVRDEAGRVTRLIGSSRNVSRQVLAEEALRQSQKMEAMGQLTGGVAHDFNNLLSPIIGGLDLLQRRGVGDERAQRTIAGALASAERAKTLVQRLLAFARRQPLQPTAVDVQALVRGMADLVASTTGPQVKVVVEVPEGVPPARGDANQLEMALLNLSVNARDAMPDGGTLTIAADEESIDAVHRSKLPAGRYVRLSVADTGVGMDEATLEKAVEPFFSTKGIGKGTGLGLSMVHGLAAQLGGALHIASKPGLGTKVELWLPIAEEPGPEAEQKDTADGIARSGTALLVDDEELVRTSTADMLGELGYKVIEADSAEAALQLLGDGLRPDLLVTDHLMPGMPGTDLARELVQRFPGTPVLIVSGYADVEGIAPEWPRLAKPFRQGELAIAVAALVAASGE
ncbi:MAG TPA: PAS domain-containing protein [Allosphingosinicella sp.]|nr:PAS domain-containing protein [Allosphingosinicella sp.]